MPFAPAPRWRGALLAGAAAAALLCAGCGSLSARTGVGPARPLTVAIDGRPNALFASLFVAAANGDFARGALAVQIATPPGDDSLGALERGAADVAVASEPQLLAARDRGAKLVAVGALVGRPLDAFVSLARRAVEDPTALSGHTVASAGTALANAQLASVIAGAGIRAAS